jgi:hypothetical protein
VAQLLHDANLLEHAVERRARALLFLGEYRTVEHFDCHIAVLRPVCLVYDPIRALPKDFANLVVVKLRDFFVLVHFHVHLTGHHHLPLPGRRDMRTRELAAV